MSKVGTDAVAAKGWMRAHKWLILRRLSQLSILALFLAGPWFGVWLIKGNLTASLLLDTVPLTDPYVWLQTMAAGHWSTVTAGLLGVAIVLGLYLLVGGRVYCSWVCPLNLATDGAWWLRNRLGLKGGMQLSRNARYWLLAATLIAAAVSGTVVWEVVNPVSIVHRGLVFGMGLGWLVLAGVFLFDLLMAKHGWCGHLCPVGAAYSLIGRLSLARVRADNREACNDCMECFAVCPEPQVIRPALKGAEEGRGPVVASPNCTNCGRCVDICSKDVFRIGVRFPNEVEKTR